MYTVIAMTAGALFSASFGLNSGKALFWITMSVIVVLMAVLRRPQ